MTELPGAIDALRRLRDRGVALALLTNGDTQGQRNKIERFGLAPFFNDILVEGELGYGKPDLRVYSRALSSLEVEPGETWMVGDNLEWDVSAPQKLGIAGIWVDYAGTGLPPATDVVPDRIMRSISELVP